MHRPRNVLSALVVLAVASVMAASTAIADSDLNGDGRDDLVVGLPDEDVGQVADAGVVNILKGSAGGISVAGDKLFNQADLGGTVEDIDRFGNAVAYGDFDNDGYDDVAVGAPAEDWNGAENGGVVHVIYGSPTGPRKSSAQVLSQAGPMAGKNESGDFFGAVLDSGDFNDDNYDDLVISIPGEDLSGRTAAGGLVVAYGSPSGITTADSQFISQKGKVPGKAEVADAFGFALAVGDFNDDGHDDLAVGTPGEDVGSTQDSGNVVVLYGRNAGINKAGDSFIESSVGLANTADDRFGYALAAGDFDKDGDDDLAIGIRGMDVGGVVDAGAVVVLQGGAAGIVTAGSQLITRTGGALGTGETGDQFGFTMTAGDFTAGGAEELVVGIPFDDVSGHVDAGSVVVITGSTSGGLDPTRAQIISQNELATATSESGDRLGERLRVGDFNGDGNDDLVIGSPSEDVASRVDNGVIYVVNGTGSGLDSAGSDRFHQGTKGVKGAAEAGDRFGNGL